MIIWLTIKAFESLFGITVSGDALGLLWMLGFLELSVEIFAVFAFVAYVLKVKWKEKK
jgi:hypothetical protein